MIYQEVKRALSGQNVEMTDEKGKKISVEGDFDESGTVDFDEFVKLMQKLNNYIHYMQHMQKRQHITSASFRCIDTDNDGHLSPEELKHKMKSMGHNLNDEQLDQMVNEADADGDGKVNYQEFFGKDGSYIIHKEKNK